MALVCKPQIEVDEIVLEMDEQNEQGAKDIMRSWGNLMPVIKIGEHVLSAGELTYFELNVGIGTVPKFTMSVYDQSLMIRKNLKDDIDKCVVFIGFKDWYIKFNGIIRNTYSEAGDEILTLSGELHNDLLYSATEQKSYKQQNITDILTDICSITKMGLYTTDNKWINTEQEQVINTGMHQIDFFEYCIEHFTENLWCIDPLYHFHIGDVEELRKRCESGDLDKYTLTNSGEQVPETPIIFTSKIYREDEEKENEKIQVDFYTINSNFTDMLLRNHSQMYINDEEHEIVTDATRGLGTQFFNTYPGNGTDDNTGFVAKVNPLYEERVNKLIGGVLIELTLKNLLFEISPFDVVGFECYLPQNNGEPMKLDEEHSGNKIVIGYSYYFERPVSQRDRLPSITQKIQLI